MPSEQELFELVEGLTAVELETCVSAGWIVPATTESGARQFQDIDVARLRLIRELRVDLALGDEAVPVILNLLDQIHALRYRLKCLSEALADQPSDVRDAVFTALEAHLARGR